MILRLVAMVCALVAVAALGAAGYLYWFPPPVEEGPGLVIGEPDRVIPDLVAGREIEVAFRIHNRSGEMRRVIGGDPRH